MQTGGTRFLETKIEDWDLGTLPICLPERKILYHSKAGPPALSLTLLPGTRRGVGLGGRGGDGVVVEI